MTTADDFGFWVQPQSDQVAREVDFIVLHAYAMWNGKTLAEALDFTKEKYAEVARLHPDRTILLGEAGWATRKHTEGDQAKYIQGEPGEAPQRVFYEQFTAWVVRERIVGTWLVAGRELEGRSAPGRGGEALGALRGRPGAEAGRAPGAEAIVLPLRLRDRRLKAQTQTPRRKPTG